MYSCDLGNFEALRPQFEQMQEENKRILKEPPINIFANSQALYEKALFGCNSGTITSLGWGAGAWASSGLVGAGYGFGATLGLFNEAMATGAPTNKCMLLPMDVYF